MAKRLPGVIVCVVILFFLLRNSERLLRDDDSFDIASQSVMCNRIYKQYNKRSVRKPYETSLFRRALAFICNFFFRLLRNAQGLLLREN